MLIDDVRKNELLARLYLKNGQTKNAVMCLENLLRLNSSNQEYYKQILAASEIDIKDPANDAKVLEILQKYEEVLPKSNAHKRLAIEIIQPGEEFKAKLINYLRPLIIKGVPSIINDMRSLYSNKGKVEILGNLLLDYATNMENEMVLSKDDQEEQDPTVQFWLYYYISHHYMMLGNYEESLNFLNKAIAHTPTVVDLYTLKAKIIQKAGNRA